MKTSPERNNPEPASAGPASRETRMPDSDLYGRGRQVAQTTQTTQTAPVLKNKNRRNRLGDNTVVAGFGCGLMFGLVIIGLVAGFGGGVLLAPSVYGFRATESALDQRMTQIVGTEGGLSNIAYNLEETRISNQLDVTQSALDAQGTRISLDNAQGLIDQTATQIAQNIVATREAESADNARQLTQIALDYASTQTALEVNATRSAQDYAATRAAIDQASTAISQEQSSRSNGSAAVAAIAVATSTAGDATVPSAESDSLVQVFAQALPIQAGAAQQTSDAFVYPTAAATLTPSSIVRPATATAAGSIFAVTAQPASAQSFVESFRQGIPAGWLAVDANAWLVTTDGIRAAGRPAWLLKNISVGQRFEYAASLDIAPAPLNEIYLLFGVTAGGDDAYAVRLVTAQQQIIEAGVVRFRIGLPLTSQLRAGAVTPVQVQTLSQPLGSDNLTLTVRVDTDLIEVRLDDETVLAYRPLTALPSGAIGVQLPGTVTLDSALLLVQ